MNIDLIMTVATCLIGISLIPQVFKSFHDKRVEIAWSTLIITTVCIFIFTCCFWKLDLRINAITNGVITLLWASLVFMKIFFKKYYIGY